MVGGPTDVVIETEHLARRAGRSRPRDARLLPTPAGSTASRAPCSCAEPAPMPLKPPLSRRARPGRLRRRTSRAARPDAASRRCRAPAEPPTRGPALRLAPPNRWPNFAAETMRPPIAARRPKPPIARRPRRAAAPHRPSRRRAQPGPAQADQNLAEMAQRLEAALRRPGAEPGPAVAVSPVDRIGAADRLRRTRRRAQGAAGRATDRGRPPAGKEETAIRVA